MNLNPGGAAMDLGLTSMSPNDAESEAEKARKKKLQMDKQRQMTMAPFMGAAGSLLNRAGNQY